MRISPRSIWITVVCVFVVYLGLIAVAIFIPASSEIIARVLLHPYVFIFVGGVVFSVVTYESYQIRKRIQKDLDKLETKYQGPIKEKLLHRELEGWEKHFLEGKFKETKEWKFDLDRRAPVFRIQGKLVKLDPTTHGATRIQEEWTVRGFTIDAENYPDIRFRGFREGEELQVEFSPFSRWVWDVFKVVDGKRSWLLNVDNDNFKLIKTELIRVLARAPFGSHNFAKMRSGESLTLTNMGSGEIKQVEIAFVRTYKTLRELLEKEEVKNVCPEVKTIEEAEVLIRTYDDYPNRISQGGVYAIGIKYLS